MKPSSLRRFSSARRAAIRAALAARSVESSNVWKRASNMIGNLLSTQGSGNRRAQNVCHENGPPQDAFELFCVQRSNIMSRAGKSINQAASKLSRFLRVHDDLAREPCTLVGTAAVHESICCIATSRGRFVGT